MSDDKDYDSEDEPTNPKIRLANIHRQEDESFLENGAYDDENDD